ncbi:MAG: hypothetical protein A3H70_03450 [Candidatus Komeilibacteria bacterium RIFCSPLOWO2_02_FULL_48_11]|uniref:Uncharacterized protein n=1 Tax=Candidatus Komeilibacteria bacterium RIFCSPLOWO2_02_FULL_48_11 TaxID=1798553 RepID=A0A1G2BVE7_9BACT|nr:MAG: hypothetical protein A3H70_03450 [Candidatus Komeilibacteria bacterium RIFCSPLOWO2_02_FULL_48_11]
MLAQYLRRDKNLSLDYRQIVSLVFSDGTVHFNAVACEECHGSNYAHSRTERETGMTVESALKAASKPVKFVVLYDRRYNNTSGWPYVNCRYVTVYVPPRGALVH